MRNLRIGVMLVICVLWAGAVWAGDAPVPQTGQVISYSAGDDGDLQKGVKLPTPRFKVSRGTVKDNLTGLIWLQNANCPNMPLTWQAALDFVAGINSGINDCGDTSKGGGHQTDWRLPNRNELQSLLNMGTHYPALPVGHPFTDFSPYYWSSTTEDEENDRAWLVTFDNGDVGHGDKTQGGHVIAVRGGP